MSTNRANTPIFFRLSVTSLVFSEFLRHADLIACDTLACPCRYFSSIFVLRWEKRMNLPNTTKRVEWCSLSIPSSLLSVVPWVVWTTAVSLGRIQYLSRSRDDCIVRILRINLCRKIAQSLQVPLFLGIGRSSLYISQFVTWSTCVYESGSRFHTCNLPLSSTNLFEIRNEPLIMTWVQAYSFRLRPPLSEMSGLRQIRQSTHAPSMTHIL